MKKKLLTLVLSAVLCLGMSVTAFAAPSPTVSTSAGVAVVNGQNVSVNVTPGFGSSLSTNQSTVVNDLQAQIANKGTEAAYKDLIASKTSAKVSSISATGVVDIQAPAGVDISAGVPITFSANGIKPGDTIIVLHLKADGTWESISATAGDGVITGTFTSLSPVVYMKVTLAPTNTNKVAAASTPADNNTAATSPKTQEANMNIVVLLMAVAAAGVIAYGKRRSIVNK